MLLCHSVGSPIRQQQQQQPQPQPHHNDNDNDNTTTTTTTTTTTNNNNNNNTCSRMSSSDASNISLHIKPSNEACHQLHPRLGTFARGKMIPCRKHTSKTESAMCLAFTTPRYGFKYVKTWVYWPVSFCCALSHRFVFHYLKLSGWWLKLTRKETLVKICANLCCHDLHNYYHPSRHAKIPMFFGLQHFTHDLANLSSVLLRPWSDLKNGQGKCPSHSPIA